VVDFPNSLEQCTGFQWDDGNSEKNWDLHRVSRGEAEQVFFNRPIVVAPDEKHSRMEPRYAALGQTDLGRRLAVVFTIRGALLRVISARDMSKRVKKPKTSPAKFANEDEERRYWADHDLADHFDWSNAVQPTLPNLKASTTAISLRLPIAMLEELKALAHKHDVPYQSLMKLYLSERIARERARKAS